MSLPEIAGHELQDLIGSGGCGAVYRAVASGGRACAVKVYSSMSINRRSLAATMRNLHYMPPHQGVLPVHSYGFDQSPYFSVTPLVGTMTTDEYGRKVWQTPTLESECGRLSADKAWGYIYEIADAMAWLHKHGIAHGNLRPANVLIEENPESSTRITDAGQGWVGGIHHFELGDRWVHLCPDQIEDPDGVNSGQGPSWDVYSFGALAFRLLTGRLPRGEAAWNEQQEIAVTKAASGLSHELDGNALLAAIRQDVEIAWPVPTTSKWEGRRREIIQYCLDLDPVARWKDMREVVRAFEQMEADYLLDDAAARIEQEKKKQARRVRSLQFAGGALLAGLSVATILFAVTFYRAREVKATIQSKVAEYQSQIKSREMEIAALTGDRDGVRQAKVLADANLQHAQRAVDQFLTQLLTSPAGTEMEVEFSRKQLEEALAFVQQGLPALEKSPELGPERVRAYGNIGRIHMHLHQTADATGYLEKARAQAAALIEQDASSPHLPLYHQWLGQYSLLLSDIRSDEGKVAESLALLKEATIHLESGLEADSNSRVAKFECARAWLEYGIRLRMNGDMPEALVALGRLPAILDPKVIGSELRSDEKFALARGKFQLALTQRDSGKFEESAATLIEAAQEMGQLVMGSSPRNQDQALALAETYTELAEVIGTHFGTADAKEAHNQGVPILLELNRLHPEWAEVKYLLARNYGAISSLERDAGRNSEALKKKQDAIEFVNEIVSDNKDNTRYAFLLAKLRGEYAELISDMGKSKDAVPIAKQAVASLETLLGPATGAKLTPERKMWEVQLAQLYGVLGHTAENAGQKELAKTAFTSAAAQWQKLAVANAGDETIQQALNWTKNRLAKLK